MTCPICRRMRRGFGHTGFAAKVIGFDRMLCLNIFTHKEKNMVDFSPSEEQAILKGGAAGAEYLASIQQFRLDQLTGDQALTFLKSVVHAYHEALLTEEKARYPL